MNIWANCDNCKHYEADIKHCSNCLATRPPSKWEPAEHYQPPTNAQKIRAMSDEELANCIVEIGFDCHLCSEHERLSDNPLLRHEKCDEKCAEHCLEWLHAPAEGE